MIAVQKYDSSKKVLWDGFVKTVKNGHFLFLRDYMEYHAERFQDHSLLFMEGNDLLAVLPASQHAETLVSHGGLTFGGLMLSEGIKAGQVLDIFSALVDYLKSHGIATLRYKAIPHIYHNVPAEEDLYALMRHNAVLARRDVSSTINLQNKLKFSGGKKNGIAKAKKAGITVIESVDYVKFHTMVNAILGEKYDTTATHTAAEMALLAGRFPENIKLYGAFIETEMVAGALMYLTEGVAHTQYMATTPVGRDAGALDYLLNALINEIFSTKRYFDFGISTEQQGRVLNQGLISQKEMFGARAVAYDTYELQMG